MEKISILIAETNKLQAEFIKQALLRNNINIKILEKETTNSREMKEAILELKPDIVLTNEHKNDKPASDIIQEIQKDTIIKQPVFIIVSDYTNDDIKKLLKDKSITAYSISKPYNFDKLANNIRQIVEVLFS